jgi:hypothetical protein
MEDRRLTMDDRLGLIGFATLIFGPILALNWVCLALNWVCFGFVF